MAFFQLPSLEPGMKSVERSKHIEMICIMIIVSACHCRARHWKQLCFKQNICLNHWLKLCASCVYAWVAAPLFVWASDLICFCGCSILICVSLGLDLLFCGCSMISHSQCPASIQAQFKGTLLSWLPITKALPPLFKWHGLYAQHMTCSTAFVPLQLHVACSPEAGSAGAMEEAKVLQDSFPEPYPEPLWTASNWRCGPCTWSHWQKLWLPWMHGCSKWQTVQHNKWVAEKHWMCWKDTLITESCWEAFSDFAEK